jgi:hypothetical protein
LEQNPDTTKRFESQAAELQATFFLKRGKKGKVESKEIATMICLADVVECGLIEAFLKHPWFPKLCTEL